MLAAGLAGHQQSDDEGAVLLEEEDVMRPLLVHVPPENSERVLVVAGVPDWLGRRLATPGGRLLHEPGDVVIEEGQRLLRLRTDRVRPGPPPPPPHPDTPDDETVRCPCRGRPA